MNTKENQNNLRKVFNLLIKSDFEEWTMTSELSQGKDQLTREFEHRSTREKIKIIETTAYNRDIYSNITHCTSSDKSRLMG